MPPKMSTHLSPGTWEDVMHGKRDFSDVIKLRMLRWGDCPKTNVITRTLIRERQEGQSQRKGDVMMEAEAGVMRR